MEVTEIAVKLQETTDRSLRNEGRIKKLEESHEAINKLATGVAVLSEKMDSNTASLNGLAGKVEAMESRPAKRWDSLMDKVLCALAGAFIAWLLASAGV